MSGLTEFVLVETVAEHFKVAPCTIRSWVRSGRIAPWAYIKIGSVYRYNLPRVIESLFPRLPMDETITTTTQEPEVEQVVTNEAQKPLHEVSEVELELPLDADEDI